MISTSEPYVRTSRSGASTASPTGASVRAIDLCCGLGGLSLAAKQIGWKVVAGLDRNPTALKTFRRNFPETEAIEGSVRSPIAIRRCQELLESNEGRKSSSVILSGPPCQGFSAAGSRDPKDPRNKVLVAVARAIAALQPRCAIIENVSMLLAEKHGTRLDTFEQVLADGGYHVVRVLLDASEFGVCQKRRRAFFFVTRVELDAENILERLKIHTVPAKGAKEAFRGLPPPPVRPDDYDDEKLYLGVMNHMAMSHRSEE